MRVNSDGTAASPATLNTYIAAVKSLLGFAHTVGFTRFNASPLIKIKKAPRQLAQRILSDVDVKLLLRSARTERDRLLLETAYFGGLRISELASLTWGQVLPRETGEVQLAIVGKGDKPRHVLLPADIAAKLNALRGDAKAKVFPISTRRINHIIKSTAKRAGINPGTSAHWLRHAHASHAIDNGAPITLVSQHTRPCRPQDDERLRPRQAEREFKPVPQAVSIQQTYHRRSLQQCSGRLCHVQCDSADLSGLKVDAGKRGWHGRPQCDTVKGGMAAVPGAGKSLFYRGVHPDWRPPPPAMQSSHSKKSQLKNQKK